MIENAEHKDLIALDHYNDILKEKSPEHIIRWALSMAERPIITSNFRPYATVLIHALTQQKNDILVIWCDTRFNTQSTYEHIKEVEEMLNLNLHKYEARFSKEFMSYYYGIPDPNDRVHALFTEMVKIEPFRREIKEHKPAYDVYGKTPGPLYEIEKESLETLFPSVCFGDRFLLIKLKN